MLNYALVKRSIAGLILAASTTAALAAIQNPSLDMVDLLGQLQQKGYTGIYKVKQQDDIYIVKAVTEQGQHITLRINSAKPNIVNYKREHDKYLTLLNAAKKVTAAGYHNITKIKRNGHENRYEIKAYDNNNKQVKLYLDIITGKLTQSSH